MSRILTKDGKAWPAWKLQPPPEGAPGVGPWVYERYQILRRHRDKQGLVELWSHNHEQLRGNIFKNKSKFTQVIANIFFKIHNSMKANLTDNKPKASIMPNGQTADAIADGWQARYDTWWEARQQQLCLQESVGCSELYGYQGDQMRFNPDLEGGLGEIETHRLNTYGVLFWPGHVAVQTQPGMCTYEAMELGEIYDRWPEAEAKVKADADYSEQLGESRAWTRGNRSKNLRPMGSATGYVVPGEDGPTSAEGAAGIQRAMVIQFWVKDYSMQWVDPRTGKPCKKNEELYEPMVDPQTGQPAMQPMIDDATGQPVFTGDGQPAMVPVHQKIEPEEWSQYPGFLRCIFVTSKGEVVLEDTPNPSINPDLPRALTSQCYLWDKFPFLKRFSYSDDISEYGLCIFEQIETLVVEVCKKLTQYGVHLERTCRNPLLIPNGSMDQKIINNLPARVWPVTAGMSREIRFLDVPPAPNDLLGYIKLCIELIDSVTGITDVSEGRQPTGVTAGNAIAELQNKAQTAHRIKIRNNDIYLEEQGRMFISLGQNWYTEEEHLRYEGKGAEQMLAFKGVDYQGELAFHIEAGSTMPRSREVRRQQVMELAKAKPNFPNKVLCEELAIPNADEVAAQMDAGPMGMAMQKLQQSGLIPPEMLQTIQNIVQMDDKDFKSNFGSGNPLDVAGGQ